MVYRSQITNAILQTEGTSYFALTYFFSFDWVPAGDDRINFWADTITAYCDRLIA